ncbi:hypothetical protein D7Z54_04050 [Salibacterium salarium]|uniref:Uncharacterized protein n=1 Tax=Salibacterium salarium TaxID=284579 RepID=A0A3R9PB05_9BACI|nr:hypothetical protein D7Z54_04050 [Salibacterium salarium]
MVPLSAGIGITFLYSCLLFHMSMNGAFLLTAVLPLVLVFLAGPDRPWPSYFLLGASEGFGVKMGVLWLVNACLLCYAATGSVTTYLLKRGDQE